MHHQTLASWQHTHTFGQEQKRPGESRTLIVIAITATMMFVEIAAGLLFGSMALLADVLHMASHAAALSINFFAYVYARRHARDVGFSFGTGKVNALGGFSSAILLAVFALTMIGESVQRIFQPVAIAFDQAIFVAIVGLVVNGVSVFILGHDHAHEHHHDHEHHEHHDAHEHDDHDHNLRAAYFHVLADAFTSVLAIAALLFARFAGSLWVDPIMGIVGAVLVSRWSLGLMRSTSSILLDKQGPAHAREEIRTVIEQDGDSRIADLHLWSIGPDLYSAIVSVVAHVPQSPDYYKQQIPPDLDIVHLTVEVHPCVEAEAPHDEAARLGAQPVAG